MEKLIKELQNGYGEMLSISKELLEQLEKGASESKLGEVIDRRQKALDKVAAIEEEVKKKKVGSAKQKGLEKLKDILQEILAIDEQCKKFLQEYKSKISTQLSQLNKGSAAAKGYKRGKGNGPAKFISIKE